MKPLCSAFEIENDNFDNPTTLRYIEIVKKRPAMPF
jgi:hypothetical protein